MLQNVSPLFSIIISCFNHERFIRPCLESCLSLRGPHREIIVVDDGSTDQSPQIIQQYTGEITCLRQSNQGQASALNSGYRISKGEIIWFLDGDDCLLPDALNLAASAFNDPATAMVSGQCLVIDARGERVPSRDPFFPIRNGDVTRKFIDQSHIRHATTSGLSFRRCVLDQLMPIPEKRFPLAPDGYLGVQMPFLGHFSVLPSPVYNYRIHETNHSVHFQDQTTRLRNIYYYSSIFHHYKKKQAHQRKLPIPSSPGSLSLVHAWTAILIRKCRHRSFSREIAHALRATCCGYGDTLLKKIVYCAGVLSAILLPFPLAFKIYNLFTDYRCRR